MSIKLANTVLAGIELEAAYDLRINGQIIVQPADIFRALERKHYLRGNAFTTLSFSVSRVHDSVRLAKRFWLLHYASLPKEGDLRLTVGEPGDVEDIIIPDAKLPSVDIVVDGVGTISTYNLLGGLPTDGGPPVDTEPYDDVIRRNRVSITNGASSVAVVFGTSLPSAPFVTATVLKPTGGGDNIWCTIPKDSITNNGFTAELSGPVPNGNYELSYIAIV